MVPGNHYGRSLPVWSEDLRELRFRGKLVKRYKQPATDQVLILQAFHEQGWPPSIDDPLPPKPGRDPKERLHDVINHLNRKQRVLHFFGLGTGTKIGWEPR